MAYMRARIFLQLLTISPCIMKLPPTAATFSHARYSERLLLFTPPVGTLYLRKRRAQSLDRRQTAALAPEYAGILVSGVKAFMLEIFIMVPPFLSAISRANSCVGNKAPIKLR